ncbi:MAG: DUF3598 family protein [Leptolyngbyaceae cyanobacterium bins.349]|nr:DUF3598 family protein [Leptolyngbyaceae cyanobacterium bins.349]
MNLRSTKSQWECLLQNLGEWQGSFTRLSPQGEQLEDTPTIVSLEGLNQNQTVRQTIRRLTTPVDEKVLEYSSLGRGVMFLDTGAFSQGAIQFGPFSEFGAELGLIETSADHTPGDRRLRLVQLFDQNSQLHQLTLIREHRAGAAPAARSPLTVKALLGTWEGTATTVYPDWQTPTTYTTSLHIDQEDDTHLTQTLTLANGQVIHSTAAIEGHILRFHQGPQTVQVLLLPDGASSTCPTQIKPRQPFFLEVGWLLQPHRRQRLIRSYSDRGDWSSLTLVTEQKVAGG